MLQTFRCGCKYKCLLGKQKGEWFHSKIRDFSIYCHTPVVIKCPYCGNVYLIEKSKKTGSMRFFPKVIKSGRMNVRNVAFRCRRCGYILYYDRRKLRVKCPSCGGAMDNQNPLSFRRGTTLKDNLSKRDVKKLIKKKEELRDGRNQVRTITERT